ncbi:MAG: WD40 repeat-containing serine/threonine protein kinase, partial [Planctomycetota bacterium]
AASSGIALSLLIAVAGVEWNARLRVESALSDTDLARRRAEANVDLAVDAFDSILDNVTSRGVPRSLALDLPQSEQGLAHSSLSEADAELLHRLLGFYRQFAAENARNTRLRERVAMADQRTGAILVRLGRLTEAEVALRRSLDGLQTLLEADPHQTKLLVMSAQIHNEIGELLLRRGQFRETFNAHLEALAVFLDQPDSVLTEPAVRYERARATDLFASIDIRSGTNQAPGGPGPDERGNGPPRRGPDDRRPPPDFDDRPPPPDDRGPRREFENRRPPPEFGDRPPRRPDDRGPGPESDRGPRPLQNLDDRLLRAMPAPFRDSPDKLRSLATVLLDASNELRALTQEFPDNAQYQFSLAQCLRHRLVHATSTGEAGVASDTFHEAVRLLEQLAEQSPNEPKFLFELADTLTQASRAQSSTDAEESLDRAVSDAEQLATRFANVSEYQLLLGTALARRAAIQESRGAINEAASGLTQAIAILEPLGAKFPDQGVLQIPLAKTRRQLADLLRATAGHGDAATTRLEESRTLLLKAIADFEHYLSLTNTQSQFNHHTQTGLNNSLAETLMQLNRPDGAAAARRQR